MSRLLGEMLERLMPEEQNYHAAMKRYLSGEPQVLNETGAEYPKREELYVRDGLR